LKSIPRKDAERITEPPSAAHVMGRRRGPTFRFRLYVAGNATNSTQAIANLTALCREHLPRRHEIDVVDVFKHPERALDDGILMTPALVRLSPTPVRSMIGALANADAVLLAMGMDKATS
jgi:circadian clock protein KaiB